VRIENNLPRALRFAAALQNGARSGPHPRLNQPLPAPARGMVDPECPVADASTGSGHARHRLRDQS
jgi:hypothetical protein